MVKSAKRLCAAWALTAWPSLLMASPIEVTQAWIRQMPPNSYATALYFSIRNTTEDTIVLISASAPKLFDYAEFHETTIRNGRASMEKRAFIKAPGHGHRELKPKGLHIMLMGLKRSLKEGESIPITLKFEKHGKKHLSAVVLKQAPSTSK